MDDIVILPNCSQICLDIKDEQYQTYSILVSGIVLPTIGFFGIFGNIFVIMVYFDENQRKFSISIYLGALGLSDLLMIFNAIFLFVLEAWRHQFSALSLIYGFCAPISFPFASIFQTTSIYFCVGAAIDCFVRICLPKAVSQIFCTPLMAKKFVITVVCSSLIYNIPHFFEIYATDCVENTGFVSLQICPTDLRRNVLYYTIYYTYCYTVFLAVGPLLLLIALNTFVICNVIKGAKNEECDTISLILVVCLFISCNTAALLVNFLELALYEKLKDIIAYLVDLSNLLVVINCTANFFVYLIFGASFRASFRRLINCHGYERKLTLEENNRNSEKSCTNLSKTNAVETNELILFLNQHNQQMVTQCIY